MKFLILPLFIILTVMIACSADNSYYEDRVKNLSPAEQLVYLDTNQLPEKGDINVNRINYLLSYISENTTSTETEIADRTSRSVTVLEEKYGKKVSNQGFLEQCKVLIQSLPQGKKESFETISTTIGVTFAN